MNFPDARPPVLAVMKIIWGVLFASLFLYLGVAYYLTTQKGATPSSQLIDVSDRIQLAFAVLSLMTFMMAFALPRVLLLRHRIALGSESVHRSLPDIARMIFPAWLVRMALLEAITLYGLVVAILHDVSKIVPFLALTLIGFLTNYPSEEKVHALLRISPHS